MRAWAAASVFVLGAAATARADPIPAALHEKSIALNWYVTAFEKILDSGKLQTNAYPSRLTLYISARGRVFSLSERMAPRGAGTAERTDREVSGSGPHLNNWRFEDGALVSDRAYARGASRLVISFTDNYANCAMRIIFGKKDGAPIITTGFLTGARKEMISATVGSTQCSITPGNVFAIPQ